MRTSSYKQSRWTGGRNWFFFYPDASSILRAENEKTMYNEERSIELSMVSLEFQEHAISEKDYPEETTKEK